MTFPTEKRAGMTTWLDPKTGSAYSVILASDFGVTEKALEEWGRYREKLEDVKEVYVSFSGIRDLPYSEHDLASFLALGSSGAGLALSGANCGYGGEGPHGTARILKDLGMSDRMVEFVFGHRDLHFVRLDGRWMVGNDLGGVKE